METWQCVLCIAALPMLLSTMNTSLRVKCPAFFPPPLSDMSQIWGSLTGFRKSPLSNFTKICPVRDALIHTDRHDETNSCFSLCMRKRLESGMDCELLKRNVREDARNITMEGNRACVLLVCIYVGIMLISLVNWSITTFGRTAPSLYCNIFSVLEK